MSCCSEGGGTCAVFLWVGTPFVDHDVVLGGEIKPAGDTLRGADMRGPGVITLRPLNPQAVDALDCNPCRVQECGVAVYVTPSSLRALLVPLEPFV